MQKIWMAVLCLHVPQLICRNQEGQITSAVSGLMHIRFPYKHFYQVNDCYRLKWYDGGASPTTVENNCHDDSENDICCCGLKG